MKKTAFILLTVNLVVFGIIGISMADHPAGHKIVICGTGDSQELLNTLARAYEKNNAGVRVHIPESIGSGGGIKATASDKCDLGRVARAISEKEKIYGLNYQVFAKSPVVFAVHSSVTGIDNLTAEQIVGIYSGKYTSWDQIGGQKQKIYPVGREDGDSSNMVLHEKLTGFKDIAKFVSVTAYSSPESIEILEKHKFTVGYGSLSMFIHTQMEIVSINGIEPSEKNVNNGTYDFATEFAIVYRGEIKGLAGSFLDYLFTPEAAEIMRTNGAFPVRKKLSVAGK